MRLCLNRPRGRRPAFTLIELMVVTGIVVVLVATLLPSLNRARESARRTACLSNMRELANGINAYVAAFKGAMPPSINTVYSYAEPGAMPPTMWGPPNGTLNFITASLPDVRVYHCPTVERELDGTMPALGYAPTELSDSNYMANGVALGRPAATVRGAARVILLHEGAGRSNAVFCRPLRWRPGDFYGINYYYKVPVDAVYQQWHKYAAGVEDYANAHVDRGEGGTNLIFVDGHGEYRRYKSLRSGDYGLIPDEPWTVTNSQLPDAGGNWLGTPYKGAF